MSTRIDKNENAAHLTIDLLEKLVNRDATGKVNFRLWDGICWPDDNPRPATVVLNHPGALRAMLIPPTDVGLGEAYLYGDFDIEGDIETIYELAEAISERVTGPLSKLNLARDLMKLPADSKQKTSKRGPSNLSGEVHSIERDRQAIAYHYDVSNDFYALWLDGRMVYSCAYFSSPDDDLDTAQERKLDYICRKLRLQSGQRLLDVGCGWGGLVIHAAMHYNVDATGITLSRPQAELANAKIDQMGLADRCQITLQDYREVNTTKQYDALVSVGMFEHVGAALLPTYFSKAREILKPGGVFLNHGIASHATEKRSRSPSFSDTYVFPDGELVPINTTLHAAEEAGFEVRDVESLREHYAKTLRHWVRRLEEHHDQALKYVDEPTYRVWRLFMSGFAYGFTTGHTNVYQALLVLPDERGVSGLPLTRADWYIG